MRRGSVLYPPKPPKLPMLVWNEATYFPQCRNHLVIYHLKVVVTVYVVSKKERANHTSIANQPHQYSYLVTVIISLILKVYGLLTTGAVLPCCGCLQMH